MVNYICSIFRFATQTFNRIKWRHLGFPPGNQPLLGQNLWRWSGLVMDNRQKDQSLYYPRFN